MMDGGDDNLGVVGGVIVVASFVFSLKSIGVSSFVLGDFWTSVGFRPDCNLHAEVVFVVKWAVDSQV